MNAQQRNIVEKAVSTLEAVQAELEAVRDENQDSFDNLSEGLQQAENGQKMETAVGELTDAIDSIGYALNNLGNIE